MTGLTVAHDLASDVPAATAGYQAALEVRAAAATSSARARA